MTQGQVQGTPGREGSSYTVTVSPEHSDENLIEQFRGQLWHPVSLTEFKPGCVYHYTTADGFAGIVNDGFVRATNFSFLNDPSEVKHGFGLACDFLGEMVQSLPESRRPLVEKIIKSLDSEAIAEVYVSCFTRLEDDLSQWRAYGSAAVERFAVGFDVEELDALSEPNTTFAEVIYEKAEQIDRIRFFVDRTLGFIDRDNLKPERWPVLAAAVAQMIARVLPELKDVAYKNEKEWRLIHWQSRVDGTPEIDASRGILRPFVKLVLPDPLPILDVRVMAPTRTAPALKAVDMLLRKAGLEGVKVVHSTVPFAD